NALVFGRQYFIGIVINQSVSAVYLDNQLAAGEYFKGIPAVSRKLPARRDMHHYRAAVFRKRAHPFVTPHAPMLVLVCKGHPYLAVETHDAPFSIPLRIHIIRLPAASPAIVKTIVLRRNGQLRGLPIINTPLCSGFDI